MGGRAGRHEGRLIGELTGGSSEYTLMGRSYQKIGPADPARYRGSTI